MKNQTLVTTAMLVIIASGLSFFGGMKYAQSTSQPRNNIGQFRQSQNLGTGQNGQGQIQRNNFRPITGEVINRDDKSMTVKTQDGGSKIVILSTSTIYNKTENISSTDITVGSTVGVFGTENSDKSMTAQNIQLNPQFRMNSGNTTNQKQAK